MRFKSLALAIAVAGLAIGAAPSRAALQEQLAIDANFDKAGGPGSINFVVGNLEPSGGNPDALVPSRISQLVVSSKSVSYNTRALPYCHIVPSQTPGGKDEIPTNAAGNNTSDFLAPAPGERNSSVVLKNCPLKTLVGQGTFEVVIGHVNQPFDATQTGLVTGKIYVYNYKPRPGDQAAFVAWVQSDNPVPNANQYAYVGVSKSGVLTTAIPDRGDIPPNLGAVIPDGIISLTRLNLTLTAPKPPKSQKPIFTIKSFAHLSIDGRLNHDDAQ